MNFKSRLPVITVAVLGTLFATPAEAWFDRPQQIELQDSVTSPDGTWVVERYLEIYSEDTAIRLALHHPQKGDATSSQYIPFKSLGEDVVFKWLDDSNLLIAAPEGNDQHTRPYNEFGEGNRPDSFNGVKLHYAYFTYDPDKSRVVGSQKIFIKKSDFDYRFEKSDGIGVPGIDCYLNMSAVDGDYLEHLKLKISAMKTFEVKALWQDPKNGYKIDPKNPYRIDPEYSTAAVNVFTDKVIDKSLGLPTGGKLESFSPMAGKPLMGRTYRKIIAPSGSSMPSWDLVYQLNGQSDIQAIISKILKGGLKIKIDFWLGDAEVMYTSTLPKDQTAIKAFQQCVDENHIFTKKKSVE
jgi:hypothetical protein